MANDRDGETGTSRSPCGPDIGEVVTGRSIRTPEVEKASKQLMSAIEQAALNCDLAPDLVEGHLSGLMGSLWNSCERTMRRIPSKRGRQPLE